MATATSEVRRSAKRWGDSEWVERLGRLGLVAKGVSFVVVGVLALLLALGVGGRATDREGAFRFLAQEWYGAVLLVALALGFGAYATWRFAQAILDRDDEGDDIEGWAKRAGCLVKGLFYAGLSLLAMSFVLAPRGESSSEPEQTARVFELPFGRWLVAAAGAGLVAYGVWSGYRSISGKYLKHVEEHAIESEIRPLVKAVGFVGHLARMVLFSLVGVFLLRAAYRYDPNEAIGIDGALAKLAHQPGGPIWLGAAAAGLFAYGLFSLAQARYRDI